MSEHSDFLSCLHFPFYLPILRSNVQHYFTFSVLSFISFLLCSFPNFSILSTEKWGPSVPILTRIIDSEGSDKVLGDCVVFGTLFKEMHLRSSVSVREECSLKNVLWRMFFDVGCLRIMFFHEAWQCFTCHLLFFFSTFPSTTLAVALHILFSYSLHAINDSIVLHRAYRNLLTHSVIILTTTDHTKYQRIDDFDINFLPYYYTVLRPGVGRIQRA